MTSFIHEIEENTTAASLVKVRLVRGGSEYFDTLIQLINASQKTFYLLTYIYQDDSTGCRVAEAIKKASLRGVSVFVMIDAYASSGLKKKFIQSFEKEGIHFHKFNPVFPFPHVYFGRRLHAKVAVADGKIALVGGMNIADRYNDSPKIPAWLDYAIEVKGETSQKIESICQEYFHRQYLPHHESDLIHNSGINVKINDWVYHRDEISHSYLNLIKQSKQQVVLLCSYFIPGKLVRKEMKRAAQRGVQFDIIMTSKSDVPIAKYAERWLYDWLLRHNIRIFEYRPTVLHGKLAVADGSVTTIGSYNVNNISAYASVEMNVELNNKSFSRQLLQEIDKIKKHDCVEVDHQYHNHHRTPVKQFIRWSSYQLYRLIFFVTTFYFRQRTV